MKVKCDRCGGIFYRRPQLNVCNNCRIRTMATVTLTREELEALTGKAKTMHAEADGRASARQKFKAALEGME